MRTYVRTYVRRRQPNFLALTGLLISMPMDAPPAGAFGARGSSAIKIQFIHINYIFNNRFVISGKKYHGWRYAYNPCTPVDVGQNDPHADPHKICRNVAVSSYCGFQMFFLS